MRDGRIIRAEFCADRAEGLASSDGPSSPIIPSHTTLRRPRAWERGIRSSGKLIEKHNCA